MIDIVRPHMSGPLSEVGINEGEKTPLREITAPQVGDDYITSYYKILREIETSTVYAGELQTDLPDRDEVDWPLVGIAETTATHLEGESVHIYDGTEWVDSFRSVEEFVSEIESELRDDLETAEGEIESLETDFETIEGDLETVKGDVESLETDVQEVEQTIDEEIENAVDEIETDLEELEEKIDDDIEDVLADIEADIEQIDVEDVDYDQDEDVDNLSEKIEKIEEKLTEVAKAAGGLYVTDVNVPSDVVRPETLTTEAVIQNTSGAPVSGENVNLTLDDSAVDSITPRLGFNEQKTVELDFETKGKRGDYSLSVSTTEDSEAFTVTVLKPVELSIIDTTLSVSEPLVAGEAVTVEATVQNVGDIQAEGETVTLSVDDDPVDTVTPTINGGETRTIEFSWVPDETGNYSLAVEALDDSQTVSDSLEVIAPATTDIVETDHPTAVIQGKSLLVDVVIENNGDVPTGEREVALVVDSESEPVSTATVEIDSGRTDTATLFWETEGERGREQLSVITDDDSKPVTVTVQKPATLEISSISHDEITIPDQTNTVDIIIENTGDIDAIEQEIALTKSGSRVDSDTQTVRSGETTTFEFDWNTTSLGSHTLNVEVDDSSLEVESNTESEDVVVEVEDFVEIHEIDTDSANNREGDYSITFDIGEIAVGDSVYLEASDGPARWSAVLPEHESTRVEQDGSIDVSHLATVDIDIYDNRHKDRHVYTTSVSVNTVHSYSDLTSVSSDLDLSPLIRFNQIDTGSANNSQGDYSITFDMGAISTDAVYVEAETGRTLGDTATWSATLPAHESTRVEQDGSEDVRHDATIGLRIYNSRQKDILLYQRDVSANTTYSNITSLGPQMVVLNAIDTGVANNREGDYSITIDTGTFSVDDVYVEATTSDAVGGTATWSATLSPNSRKRIAQDGSHDVVHSASIDFRVYASEWKEELLYQRNITPNSSYSDVITLSRHLTDE